MAWENLPMRDRATIIRLGVQSGLRDMSSIRETYNKFAEGGELDSTLNRGDTAHMQSEKEAEWFTKNYTRYYPTFNRQSLGDNLSNKYPWGGAMPEQVPIEAQAGLYGGQRGQQIYGDYIQNGPRGAALVSKDTAKRIYAGMSALGYGLQFLGPIGRGLGLALQIPDTISDIDELSKEQSGSNVASTASDLLKNTETVKEVWPEPIGKNKNIQLAKRPKLVRKFRPWGFIDAIHDGIYSITGKDIYDIFNSSERVTNKNQNNKERKKK